MKMVFIPVTLSAMGPTCKRSGRTKKALAACTTVLVAAGAACSAGGGSGVPPAPPVVASVYPLAFIAEQIGGDEVEVVTLTPAGGEPHDLELTPSQARSIAEAELVLYVGAGFQPAVEDAVEQIESGIDMLDLVTPIQADEHEEDGGVEGGEHEGADPHAWLDPTQAVLIADAVLERLQEVAPQHAETFERRHADLSEAFTELDKAFASGLEGCDTRTIVVSHEAFGYLTERYGLEQVGIAGINPEQEPSPQRLAEVTRFVSENGIETIFLEKAVSSEVGDTVARETRASVAYLDPLEVGPEEGDLFTVMEANLDALEKGLGCGGAV